METAIHFWNTKFKLSQELAEDISYHEIIT